MAERRPIDLEAGWSFMDKGILKLKRILENEHEAQFTASHYMNLYTCVSEGWREEMESEGGAERREKELMLLFVRSMVEESGRRVSLPKRKRSRSLSLLCFRCLLCAARYLRERSRGSPESRCREESVE